MWKVRKEYLLLIAALVWGAAGISILVIGITAYAPYVSLVNVLLSIATYVVFGFAIFFPLVRRHTMRITSYRDKRQYFWKFFDLKSFIIMIVMMTLGIILRSTPAVPRVFIAVFYAGLGAALLTAGIMFGVQFSKLMRKNLPYTPHRGS